MSRVRVPLAGLIAVTFALTGCASAVVEPVAVSAGRIVIDVRSPGEYAEGHLDGARLLDLTGGEFAAATPALDPAAGYLVYCRSGNRSAQAARLLTDAGFRDVTDLGSLEEASAATGLPVVR